VLKLSAVDFEKVGMPYLPPKSSASTSETIQHTLYGGLLMPFAVLGAMTYVAKRNVHHEDDALAAATTSREGVIMSAQQHAGPAPVGGSLFNATTWSAAC
jgi:hypothetical protein